MVDDFPASRFNLLYLHLTDGTRIIGYSVYFNKIQKPRFKSYNSKAAVGGTSNIGVSNIAFFARVETISQISLPSTVSLDDCITCLSFAGWFNYLLVNNCARAHHLQSRVLSNVLMIFWYVNNCANGRLLKYISQLYTTIT